MVTVEMLDTKRVREEDHTKVYHEGEVYDAPARYTGPWIRYGYAERVPNDTEATRPDREYPEGEEPAGPDTEASPHVGPEPEDVEAALEDALDEPGDVYDDYDAARSACADLDLGGTGSHEDLLTKLENWAEAQ